MRLRSILLALITVGVARVARADEPAPDESAVEPEAVPTRMLAGHVTDATTKLGMPAVAVRIVGPNGEQTLATDLDGAFTIALPPGRYTLEIATPEYVTAKQTIDLAQELSIDVALAPVIKAGKAETIEVYDTIDTHKSSAVLAQRRAAATVSDAVSAEQIARSPDSNASDAAKRMVAATIEDNRYVVIRGLGGRYSVTLLNGVPLPSPDPDIPAAPLDLFPAALVTNLTVHKTFAPDMPGNFAGGAVDIETRSYPSKFTFKAKVGMANDSASTFRSINGQTGGSLDALGFDDGGRALPSAIPTNQLAGDYRLTPEQRNAQIASFPDTWGIRHSTATPNLNLAATIGDSLKLSDQRLGYFASASFGHGYVQRIAHIARIGGDDGMGGKLPSLLQLDDRQGIEQAHLGAIGALGWTPASGHKIDVFSLYAHNADITASEVTGTDNTSAIIDRTRLSFVERQLVFSQLIGEHKLGDGAAIVEWQGNVARVAQHEPDTRDLLRTQTTDGRFAISSGTGGAERLYGELADTTLGGTASVKLPFDAVTLKAGTAILRSARTYQARRFHFDLVGDAVFLAPEQAFSPDSAGASMSMYESTLPSDGYVATRTVAAAYAMADAKLTDKLRLVGGARFELSDLDVGLDSKIDLMAPPMPHTTHDDRDILPSLNAVYALTPDMNLRAAYAITVGRPNFREIAPALYYDYVRRRVIGGNPDLSETKIHNADLRWEAFLGDSEVIAASVFAKHFSDPIERTVESGGDGDNVGFANADTANSYGVELEARLSLGRLTPALAAFSVGGNLSLIGSRVHYNGATRALQGQSPYVANVGVGYESPATRTRIDALYNSFGRRIEEVGTGGAGNVYEEPFHRLDLTVTQPLPRNVRLKLAGSNLLDQRVVRTQDGVEIFAYQVGVTVVGSVELSIE